MKKLRHCHTMRGADPRFQKGVREGVCMEVEVLEELCGTRPPEAGDILKITLAYNDVI